MREVFQFGGMAGVAGGLIAALLYFLNVHGEEVNYGFAFIALLLGTLIASGAAFYLLKVRYAKAEPFPEAGESGGKKPRKRKK
ncbi:MAG TPA: hypothetical protein VJA40_02170 [archaeon]|nr:hypothetical protein [archaeon]